MLMKTRKPIRKPKRKLRSERGVLYGKELTGKITNIIINDNRHRYKEIIIFLPNEKDESSLIVETIQDEKFRKLYKNNGIEKNGNILCINSIIYQFIDDSISDQKFIHINNQGTVYSYTKQYLLRRLNYGIQILMDMVIPRTPGETRSINVKEETAEIVTNEFTKIVVGVSDDDTIHGPVS